LIDFRDRSRVPVARDAEASGDGPSDIRHVGGAKLVLWLGSPPCI
jgi:hypothetical protein